MTEIEKKSENIRKRRVGIYLAVFVAVFLGLMLTSVIRQVPPEFFCPKHYDKTNYRRFVEKWTQYVGRNSSSQALLMARRLTIEARDELPPPAFIKLFESCGLRFAALSSPFCDYDFIRWRDALELKTLFNRMVDRQTALIDILSVVNTAIKPLEHPLPPTGTVMEIWHRRTGSFNDKARLIANLALYAGYQTSIVLLVNKHGRPVYPLLEFYGNGRFAVADIIQQQFWKDVTVDTIKPLANWPLLAKKAFSNPHVYFVAAEPAQYRTCERHLMEKLSKYGKHLICLGGNPLQRREEYIKSRKLDRRKVFYWDYPIQGALNSKLLPAEWRIKKTATDSEKAVAR